MGRSACGAPAMALLLVVVSMLVLAGAQPELPGLQDVAAKKAELDALCSQARAPASLNHPSVFKQPISLPTHFSSFLLSYSCWASRVSRGRRLRLCRPPARLLCRPARLRPLPHRQVPRRPVHLSSDSRWRLFCWHQTPGRLLAGPGQPPLPPTPVVPPAPSPGKSLLRS